MSESSQSWNWRAGLVFIGTAIAILVVGEAIARFLLAQDKPLGAVWLRAITIVVAHLWITFNLYRFAQRRWVLAGMIHNGIIAVAAGVMALLIRGEINAKVQSRPFDTTLGSWGIFLLLVACAASIVLMFRAYKQRIEWRYAATLVTASVAGVIMWAACSIGLRENVGVAFAGITAMSVGFLVGLVVIRYAMWPGIPMCGVARTLIDEAIRMKAALIFIIGILLILPVMPLILSDEQKLSYRLQFFLGWSMGVVSVLLSVLTIFLACGSVAFEIQKKQIFMTMVKPLNRWEYLLGKWLGIGLLNLLLLAVAGGGIYTFARMMQASPALDSYDYIAVNEQVLAARVPLYAQPLDPEQFEKFVAAEITSYESGAVGTGLASQVTADERQALLKRAETHWRTIKPNGTETYVFRGLEDASRYGRAIQIRIQPKMSPNPPDRWVRMRVVINGYPLIEASKIAARAPHEFDLPADWVDDNGELHVTITHHDPYNPDPAATHTGTMRFEEDEGLIVFYQAGTFAPNLARALMVTWLKLSFLSMVGIAAASMVSFPVACLMAGLVYEAVTFSDFIQSALKNYGGAMRGGDNYVEDIWFLILEFFERLGDFQVWEAMQTLIRFVGTIFMIIMPSFSDYNVSALMRDGHYVSPTMLGSAFLEVGVLCTGVAFVIGWLIFRYRELAKVTV